MPSREELEAQLAAARQEHLASLRPYDEEKEPELRDRVSSLKRQLAEVEDQEALEARRKGRAEQEERQKQRAVERAKLRQEVEAVRKREQAALDEQRKASVPAKEK